MDLEFKAFLYEAKREYPNIFTTNIKGENFIFRPLTKYEFEELVLAGDILETDRTESICELCTIYPEDYDFENCRYAGTPDTLADEIVEVSGYGNENKVQNELAKKRAQMDEIDYQMENVILAAFPHITPEELMEWDFYKTIDYFARAEWIIENLMTNYSLPEEGQEENTPQQPMQHMQEPQTMGQNFQG